MLCQQLIFHLLFRYNEAANKKQTNKKKNTSARNKKSCTTEHVQFKVITIFWIKMTLTSIINTSVPSCETNSYVKVCAQQLLPKV